MKRRDFLSATAGLAGAMLPFIARGETKPCPPDLLSVSGAGSVKATCGEVGSAPSWFVAMPEKRWAAVASASGDRLVDVKWPDSVGFGGSFSGVTQAWTGGCVDQTRGELVFAANGGHADYAGNEVYACSIRSETPRWYRLTDPSPASVVTPVPCEMGSLSVSSGNSPQQQGHNPANYAAMFRDGRMRAVHGWNTCQFANGKVWYPYQASPSGIGYSTPHAWSFNRNSGGIPTAPGAAPLAWQNNPGPWSWLGASHPDGVSLGTAPPTALDPVTGKIWYAHGNQAPRAWASLDTQTGTIQGSAINVYAANTGQDGRWAAVVVDPSGQDRWRMFVAPAPDGNGVVVLNLKVLDPFSPGAWSIRPVSDLAQVVPKGLGATYHKASRSILLGNPKTLGGRIVKLRVPTNNDGTYNASATWSVSTIEPTAGSADPAAGVSSANNGAYSKFNLIEDMGNGQSALVVCMEVNAPTFVLKVPVQEIT